jgi:hypothetical protein
MENTTALDSLLGILALLIVVGGLAMLLVGVREMGKKP